MKIPERHAAKTLRAKGYSLKEIAKKLQVAKSSVSMWVRNIELSPLAEKRLLTKIKLGQFIAARNKKAKTKKIEDTYFRLAKEEIKLAKIEGIYAKILCVAIYWCEGIKNPSYGMTFINSDPHLMELFISLLRKSFVIREEKFKPLLHLHSYHEASREIDFWSKVTRISKSQFLKPYIKPNTRKRIRNDYHGCLSLRYFNADLGRQMLALGKALLKKDSPGA